jgi:hypothetical protein
MLSYLALLAGTVSAIVGVLIKPQTKGADGVDRFNYWVVVFVLLPIISFGIGAVQYYQQSREKNSLADQLKKLQISVNNSADKIDSFVIEVTHLVDAAGLSPRAKELIAQWYLTTNIFEGMFATNKDMTDEDKEMMKLITEYIDSIGDVAPQVLVIRKNSPNQHDLYLDISDGIRAAHPDGELRSLGMALGRGIEVEKPRDGTIYYLENPWKYHGFPPLYIKDVARVWQIKANSSNTIEVNWRYTLSSDTAAGFRLVSDYVGSSYTLVAPRFMPVDIGGVIHKPISNILRARLQGGGLRYEWSQGQPKIAEIAAAATPRDEKQPVAAVVQLERVLH